MTVGELIKVLKKHKKDTPIFMCKDYCQNDDNGNLTDLYELNGVFSQRVTCDMGMYLEDCEQIVLDFNNESQNQAV